MMHIGIDFDNTIVCYDNSFGVLAEKIKNLPGTTPRNKLSIRDYLRSQGREEDWVEFQGLLYGPGMKYAAPFKGAIEAMKSLLRDGHSLSVISHRSKYPYGGPQYDLHSYASKWIEDNLVPHGLFKLGESCGRISFHTTLESKLQEISSQSCDVFIDDLPKVICSEKIKEVRLRYWFIPDERDGAETIKVDDIIRIGSWSAIYADLASRS